eukprot:g2225.t1
MSKLLLNPLLFSRCTKGLVLRCRSSCSRIFSTFSADLHIDDELIPLTGEQRKLFSTLAEFSRAFPIRGNLCDVLETPTDFFETLLECVENAKSRITLASLYIGTGEQEIKLLKAVESACERNPALRVNFFLDASRASRAGHGESSISLHALAKLVEAHPNRISVGLFLPPQLWGFLGRILPPRFREAAGVQHLKAYVFDDTLIMSGANLSKDYFTDRQDRYIRFNKADELSSHYHELVSRLLPFCSTVQGGNVEASNPSASFLSPAMMEKERDDIFKSKLSSVLHDISATIDEKKNVKTKLLWKSQNQNGQADAHDTWVVPSLQLARLSLKQDQRITETLLSSLQPYSYLHMATAYYNLPDCFSKLLCSLSKEKNVRAKVLLASPNAHGFLGAKGISASLPLAYSYITRLFFEKIERGKNENLQLFEWSRKDWTFHAKGCWLSEKLENDDEMKSPWFSIIGSSNFGQRSVFHDLESQLYLSTENKKLRLELGIERDRLWGKQKETGCNEKVIVEKINKDIWERPERKLKGWSWKNGSRSFELSETVINCNQVSRLTLMT